MIHQKYYSYLCTKGKRKGEEFIVKSSSALEALLCLRKDAYPDEDFQYLCVIPESEALNQY